MTADIALEPAVKLLAGQPPDETESRAASYSNTLSGGRWGVVSGDNAATDIRDGATRLGELLHIAHALAGGGIRSALPDFGLGELARRACVAGGSMPIARGLRLFEELFRRLQRAA
eukprot:736976-Pleurochrysis_carterae.AAC.1